MLTRVKHTSATIDCDTLPDDVKESFVEKERRKGERDRAECSRMHLKGPLPAYVFSRHLRRL